MMRQVASMPTMTMIMANAWIPSWKVMAFLLQRVQQGVHRDDDVHEETDAEAQGNRRQRPNDSCRDALDQVHRQTGVDADDQWKHDAQPTQLFLDAIRHHGRAYGTTRHRAA
jgi:hypothetical protein